MEIKKTIPTIVLSVLKVDIIIVGLVFLISNFVLIKLPREGIRVGFTCTNLAPGI
jgi:hypothetical protein